MLKVKIFTNSAIALEKLESILLNTLSNSLIIHQAKTKQITTVKEV